MTRTNAQYFAHAYYQTAESDISARNYMEEMQEIEEKIAKPMYALQLNTVIVPAIDVWQEWNTRTGIRACPPSIANK